MIALLRTVCHSESHIRGRAHLEAYWRRYPGNGHLGEMPPVNVHMPWGTVAPDRVYSTEFETSPSNLKGPS